MGLSGAGVAEEDQWFAGVDPGTGCEVAEDGWGEVADSGVVEVGEPF